MGKRDEVARALAMVNGVETAMDAFANRVAHKTAGLLLPVFESLTKAGVAGAAMADTVRFGKAKRGPGRPRKAPPTVKAAKRKPSIRKGTKLDMRCRIPECTAMSKGPRHGYICADHQALSEATKNAARAMWRAAKHKTPVNEPPRA